MARRCASAKYLTNGTKDACNNDVGYEFTCTAQRLTRDRRGDPRLAARHRIANAGHPGLPISPRGIAIDLRSHGCTNTNEGNNITNTNRKNHNNIENQDLSTT